MRYVLSACKILTATLCLALVLVAGLPLTASAADKVVPPIVEAETEPRPFWTGCYIEAGGGGSLTSRAGSTTEAVSISGGVGCSYVLHNLPGKLVVGPFARFGVTVSDWSTDDVNLSLDGPLVAGGRLGTLLSASTLAYGVAGYSWAKMDGIREDGLVLGGGIETRLSSQFSLGAEYLRTDFGGGLDGNALSIFLRFRP